MSVIVCDFEVSENDSCRRLFQPFAMVPVSLPLLAPPSQQRNLIKFIFDLLNGSHESDGEERGETKEENAEKTAIWMFLDLSLRRLRKLCWTTLFPNVA